MEVRTVKIQAAAGLHDRMAAFFVQKANDYQSKIYVSFGGVMLNAKSLMGVLCLDLPPYAEVTLLAEGEDAREALYHLEKLLKEPRLPVYEDAAKILKKNQGL